jgi:hypothetical protein
MSAEPTQSKVVEINNEQAFTPDPVYKLMSIFEELADNGFEEKDIELFCGVKGAETYDFSGEDHGLGAKFMRAFRNITFDRIILDRYQRALREGHCVLMVHIHKTPQKAAAAEIIHKYNTAQVDYFGLAMTETLPDKPDTYDPDATF